MISSPTISECVVEPYNALLATHWLLDHTEVSLILDNEALYGICRNNLDTETKRITYNSLNALIAKAISSITGQLRFEGDLYDLNQFQTNLVPFPRLHFMITSMAPMATSKQKESDGTQRYTVWQMTESCLSTENFFVKIDDFDTEMDKYMAISLHFRGKIKSKEVSATTNSMMTMEKKPRFVEWCPTGLRFASNEVSVAQIPDDELAEFDRSVAMICNNTAMGRVFTERVSKKFDKLYSQRAFVHWYFEEGMEESKFAEAREDLGFLEKDYSDVLSELSTADEEDSESEY